MLNLENNNTFNKSNNSLKLKSGICPDFTIITVVYNGEDDIEETIKSIINQSYDNFEYLIIDGGSTDRTLEIINKYKNKIDVVVTQKDKGIYDAMNKGMRLASGRWINFMNSGDYFSNLNVLEKILPYLNSKYFLVAGGYTMFWKSHAVDFAATEHRIGKMISSHQAIFFNAEYAKIFPYDLKYKVGADYDVICRMLFGLSCTYTVSTVNVVRMNAVGYASQNFLIWLNDYRRIIELHYTTYKSISWSIKAIIFKYIPCIIKLNSRRKKSGNSNAG